ncbi:DNA polymerase delta subunit 3 [Hyalella azteca]|uniref:DNA polymerase delta subunit 3 n=1 Tax=Hyalella azteca TaxID=294128 RepID=A0A8B7NAF0_HYAAZ|nr:DNA polymerase delta subunit 3 [Hyalella azteca]
MASDLEMYMENLDEFVNDENKVVTYRWLSIALKLPCDVAKRLLNHFAASQVGSNKLHVMYLVIGQTLLKDNIEGTKVCIVPEEKLEKFKESLVSVSCVHVYSICKSKLADASGPLYTADYDIIRQNLKESVSYGGISCPKANQRSTDEIASSRSKGTYLPSTPQDTRNAPDPRLAKPSKTSPSKPVIKTSPSKPVVKTEGKNAAGNKNKSNAKNSLASMFAAQTNAKKDVKKEPEDVNKTKSQVSTKSKSAAPKKQNGISSFLKEGVDPRDEEPKPLQRSSTRSSPRKLEVVKTEKMDDSPEKISPKKLPTPVKTYGRAKAKPVTKPHRSRILQVDSDSSDEEGTAKDSEDEEEDPIPPSPPANASDDEDPAPKLSPCKPTRGKKRKEVDQTYEEDGFIVTKKTFVDVTDSEPEDEAPPPAKKPDRSSSPSKTATRPPEETTKKSKKPSQAKSAPKASPVKSKQASITSFFKKK